MNFSHNPKLERFTESLLTKLGGGSRASDLKPTLVRPQVEPSKMDTLLNAPAPDLARSFMSGIEEGQPNCLTEWVIQGPIMILNNGSIGQELVDADGKIIAWTTDPCVAHKMLNERVAGIDSRR
jgi:hypothetical protein